jgi:hypothetical protein
VEGDGEEARGRGRNFKLETLSRAFLCLEITDAGAPCLERGGTFDSDERERLGWGWRGGRGRERGRRRVGRRNTHDETR